MSKIPKIIHYCWFGRNPLPETALKCINSWKKHCPDYVIKEWNEDNFDIHMNEYVEQAYNAKKWAFVSDFVRFYALTSEGGIYLETDTEVLKPIDKFHKDSAFLGFGSKTVTLSIVGLEKGHSLGKAIMDYYNSHHFTDKDGNYDMTTVNQITFNILKSQFGLQEDSRELQLIDEGIVVYPKSFFFTDWDSGKMQYSNNNYVLHYADASWKSDEERYKKKLQRRLVGYLGEGVGKSLANILWYLKYKGVRTTVERLDLEIKYRVNPIFVKYCPFPIKNNKIIFNNFNGLGYGCNPKYIAEEILRRNLDIDLVWITKPNSKFDFPEGIRTVKWKTLKYYYELATAKVWVDNVRKPLDTRKRNGQFYIQTWHGFIPFKKIEGDAADKIGTQSVKRAKNDSNMIDLILSGCKERTKLYKQSFWYSGEIAEYGSPRNDIFFKDSSQCREKVFKELGIDFGKKVVLYAPTFRNSHSTKEYSIDIAAVLKALNLRFGGDFVCIIRLHPSLRTKSTIFADEKNCINASYYDDIQELYKAADIMISDYSSVIFDFSLSKKPVFLYHNDINAYKKERDMYISPEELPYPAADNMEMLVEQIKMFDESEYILGLNRLFGKSGVVEDGSAASKTVNLILEKITKK
jgi:CDP-glycerol glycerophosphotransferase